MFDIGNPQVYSVTSAPDLPGGSDTIWTEGPDLATGMADPGNVGVSSATTYAQDTGSSGGTNSPSTIQQVTGLIAAADQLGLTWYSNITGKPLTSVPGPGGSVVPANAIQQTQTIILFGIAAVALILILTRR